MATMSSKKKKKSYNFFQKVEARDRVFSKFGQKRPPLQNLGLLQRCMQANFSVLDFKSKDAMEWTVEKSMLVPERETCC